MYAIVSSAYLLLLKSYIISNMQHHAMRITEAIQRDKNVLIPYINIISRYRPNAVCFHSAGRLAERRAGECIELYCLLFSVS